MSYHTFKASGQQFEIKSRYSLIRPIGHGAYGVVISALDKETGDKVAIKKISRAFEDPVDAKRILREIKLMKKFSHENVRSPQHKSVSALSILEIILNSLWYRLFVSWISFRLHRQLRSSKMCTLSRI
mmetsp:Transcript_22996/g.38506  ORF Transcript_22996/g.38506 Transcript_22996/m.38506 type:complete len:128 (+) Transcript_22996:238-621(+)